MRKRRLGVLEAGRRRGVGGGRGRCGWQPQRRQAQRGNGDEGARPATKRKMRHARDRQSGSGNAGRVISLIIRLAPGEGYCPLCQGEEGRRPAPGTGRGERTSSARPPDGRRRFPADFPNHFPFCGPILRGSAAAYSQAMRRPWLRCRHRRLTFPLTTREDGGAAHVTCLDCGREFWYDWERMRRGKERSLSIAWPDEPPAQRRGAA